MEKREIYKLEQVFTPSKPADISFVERVEINKRLERALRTGGKQIIIYGFSGVGKTTLLFNKLKESKIGYIKTSCITGMVIQDILIDAFNQLDVFYVTQRDLSEGSSLGGNIEDSFLGIKAGLKSDTKDDNKTTHKKAVELPITPQNLAKFIGYKNLVWVIEDFHKIEESHKKQMAQIMKVFMDSSAEFPNLKIIAIGAVNSAREVVEYDAEMKSRVSEIEVPVMKIDTLKRIIETGEKLLNIKFTENVINRIATYSSGLPAVTHQLCLLMCELNNIFETQKTTSNIPYSKFNNAMEEYLEENSDSFRALFEQATRVSHNRKNENPIDLLNYILDLNKDNFTVSQIKEKIQQTIPSYKGNNLKKYIDEFCQPEKSEILRFNENHNSYYFSNPFIKAYVQCSLKKDLDTGSKSKKFNDKFKDILKKEFMSAREAFKEDFGEFDFGVFDDI